MVQLRRKDFAVVVEERKHRFAEREIEMVDACPCPYPYQIQPAEVELLAVRTQS